MRNPLALPPAPFLRQSQAPAGPLPSQPTLLWEPYLPTRHPSQPSGGTPFITHRQTPSISFQEENSMGGWNQPT